jgi:hypothetical protein
MVGEDRVTPALGSKSLESRQRVVEEAPAARGVDVTRSYQARELLSTPGVDSDTLVSGYEQLLNMSPPGVRRGQLRVRDVRTMPRETVTQQRPEVIGGDATFRLVLVEHLSE